jgi:hypothetical protein
MLGRIFQLLLHWMHLDRHSAPEAIAAYEAAHGHPHTEQESVEFEAVSWLIASKNKPGLALKRFEQESGQPTDDLDEIAFERVRTRLQRWCREDPYTYAA